ncbi:MAG: pyridoxamine 5'-phosphate oxidase family protein [Anaerolineae bacterium]|nr:pyridoxamine 5'-phosphate oxidase family protein [Anaerolineae bacterium]
MSGVTTDRGVLESIIRQAAVCRIGLCDGGQPYVVPVCFGYEDGVLYFHSSVTGRKVDALRRNNAVCVEFDVDQEIVKAECACKWGIKYRSVIGFGEASFVEEVEEKRRALDIIMRHYGGEPQDYPEATLAKTAVLRTEIQDATAKITGTEEEAAL